MHCHRTSWIDFFAAFAAAPLDTTLGVVLAATLVPTGMGPGGPIRKGKAAGDGDDCTSTVAAGELVPAVVLARVGVVWTASEGVSLATIVVVGVGEEAFELIMPVRVCWPAGGVAAERHEHHSSSMAASRPARCAALTRPNPGSPAAVSSS